MSFRIVDHPFEQIAWSHNLKIHFIERIYRYMDNELLSSLSSQIGREIRSLEDITVDEKKQVDKIVPIQVNLEGWWEQVKNYFKDL